MHSAHVKAILAALLVVVIWSTSWILMKFGMQWIPVLTLNGLRYTLAFLVMLPFLFLPGMRRQLRELSRRDWRDLIVLGIIFIALTQGMLALSLKYLPATTSSLIISCTPIFVAFFAMGFLGEQLEKWQWVGLAINMTGVFLYFFPLQSQDRNISGIVIALACLFFNTLGVLLSRQVNRGARMNAYVVSTITLGVGGILMLAGGLVLEGAPHFTVEGMGFLIWLAVINTAVAFPLWNYSLQTLTAMESNIINNTTLIFVAILSFLFLGEGFTGQQILGLFLTAAGAALVQVRKPKSVIQNA